VTVVNPVSFFSAVQFTPSFWNWKRAISGAIVSYLARADCMYSMIGEIVISKTCSQPLNLVLEIVTGALNCNSKRSASAVGVLEGKGGIFF
jgi:hypothetical protein